MQQLSCTLRLQSGACAGATEPESSSPVEAPTLAQPSPAPPLQTTTLKDKMIEVGGARMRSVAAASGGDEVWDDRYGGATANYLDGSSDLAELEERKKRSQAGGEAGLEAAPPAQAKPPLRSGSGKANGNGASFGGGGSPEEYMAGVLTELRRLQQLIAAGPPVRHGGGYMLQREVSGHPVTLFEDDE